jgi:hypothetical protein
VARSWVIYFCYGDRHVKSQSRARRQLVDERAAAKYIDMSVAFLQTRNNGELGNRTAPPPHIKIGKWVRYDLADLDRWLAAFKPVSVGTQGRRRVIERSRRKTAACAASVDTAGRFSSRTGGV